MSADPLADLWRYVAEHAIGDDAPMYRAIALAVADDPDLLAIARRTDPEAHHPNHLFAAVRFLTLDGWDDDLADACRSADVDRAVELFGRFVRRHDRALVEVLVTRRTQTNEIGRIGLIAPALRHVTTRTASQLALLDVGASAGLNLLVDRVGCDYGSFRTMVDPPLEISTALERPIEPFTAADLRIGWRGGLDRAPIDLADDTASRWLLACVWPEQRERVRRLEAAMALARGEGWSVVEGDAVRDLTGAVAAIPDELHVVVLTSWVVFYFDRTQRRAFEDALRGLDRPVSWLSLEHPGVVDVPLPEVAHTGVEPSAVGLVSFGPDGVERSFLGWAHPHGRWLDWCPQAPT